MSSEDFIGTYFMNHDGWKGTLELQKSASSGSSSENIQGTYTSSSGTEHAVHGSVRSSSNTMPSDWGPDHKIEFYIDFADTASTSDDQKFEGYLFTRTKAGLAGKTWWNNTPFGFYAEKKRVPAPRITANGQSSSLDITEDEELSIAIQLDPGIMQTETCDWWIVLSSPQYGWFFFVLPDGWTTEMGHCLQAQPVPIYDPIPLLQGKLPPGLFTFYFVLDNESNGELDGDLWMDMVTVNISSS